MSKYIRLHIIGATNTTSRIIKNNPKVDWVDFLFKFVVYGTISIIIFQVLRYVIR